MNCVMANQEHSCLFVECKMNLRRRAKFCKKADPNGDCIQDLILFKQPLQPTLGILTSNCKALLCCLCLCLLLQYWIKRFCGITWACIMWLHLDNTSQTTWTLRRYVWRVCVDKDTGLEWCCTVKLCVLLWMKVLGRYKILKYLDGVDCRQ